MHGSRSRHVGGHPSEWSPTEPPYPAAAGHLHGHPAPSTGFYPYHHQQPEHLSAFQEPPPVPSYFAGPGGAGPYQDMSPNVALRILSINKEQNQYKYAVHVGKCAESFISVPYTYVCPFYLVE